MAGDTNEKPSSLLQTVTTLIENHLQQGPHTYDALITIMSLTCLLTILNRAFDDHQVQARPVSAPVNNMQKLLTDLVKGDGGHGAPEALMALLPLLNSPQFKNKLNPATLTSLLGLLSNLNVDKSDKGDKEDKCAEKTAYKQNIGENKKADASPPAPAAEPAPAPSPPMPPAATAAASTVPVDEQPAPPAHKGMGKYLNWKNSL